MTLEALKPGDQATIQKIHAIGALKRRLMDMGLTKGTALQVKKLAPLGDPMEITIRGYELTLRKKECECVEVSFTSR